MPAPFKQITRDQFADLLAKFPFKRKINTIHMHHTWRPNRAQYRGHDTIVGMWRYHTQEYHWSDIAQHLTIAPDGSIWLGRDWNRPPASAAGHNGNSQAGPFMFEKIGDFDDGNDPFDGEQRLTALEVIARVQLHFGLPPGALQLHNMMSTKTCPGTGIDYQTVVHDVAELHPQLMSNMRGAPADGPFQPEQILLRQAVTDAIASLQRATPATFEPADAEPCLHRDGHGGFDDARQRGDGGRELGFDTIQALRPHVVNLRMGLFSSNGKWTTTAQDVDAMFDEHLPRALQAAKDKERKLKLMLYAHGGLTSESDALARSATLVGWWKENGIYPIHFVWETGLVETLGQMLERVGQGRERGARNYFSDHVSDPLVEAFVHRAGGVQIWNAMKWSAQQSSSDNALGGAAGVGTSVDTSANAAAPGGAHYVAMRLARLCEDHPDDIELHACGHSAGAIFHAHFIPCALEQGVPGFDSLHLMAPALRVDLFRQQLQHRVGKGRGIDKLTMYTMEDSFERDDDCGAVYRKSLLYLIHKGLEPETDEPILGLERSVRGDAGLKHLFGIGGGPGPAPATVVWADNRQDQGRSASRSRTHGGFDDDPATMGSIVRRVLGKADADPIAELPASRHGANPWRTRSDVWADILAEHGFELPDFPLPPPAPMPISMPVSMQTTMPAPLLMTAPPPAWNPPPAGTGRRRRALCVGIDDYPGARLAGCVNDANAWAGALARLGFDTPQLLLDGQATRAAIVRHLSVLVDGSQAGDVIVFQFAGHGTQVPDLDGDELGGDSPGEDEALCPHDCMSGELLIDDDIRAIFGRLPHGVNLTCFMDCCHSGTIARFAFGRPASAPPPGARARFIPADRQLIEQFVARRRDTLARGGSADGGQPLRDVVFSACLSSEVALETNGQGDFSRLALQVLAGGTGGMSNGEFAERVTQAFGQSPRQHAKLYSDDALRTAGLLQPLQPAAAAAAAVRSAPRALSARERATLASRRMREGDVPSRPVSA